MEKFSLEDRPFVELNNLLKLQGWCSSGGIAKTVIANGCVKVDGKVELRKRCKIHSGQTVKYEEYEVKVYPGMTKT